MTEQENEVKVVRATMFPNDPEKRNAFLLALRRIKKPNSAITESIREQVEREISRCEKGG
jgi:hypothetical protein